MFKAKTIMTTNVISVDRQTEIYKAIKIMVENNVTGLPVVNKDMTLAGIISEKDVLELSTELALLEEKLLFPSNTQVSLFVSLAGDKDFVLDSMQITVDSKVVAQHLYTFKEIEALRAGGVQRIYTGNIKTGDHQMVASFIGRSKSNDAYQGSAGYTVTKAVGPKFVEIQITGSNASDQTVSFKDW